MVSSEIRILISKRQIMLDYEVHGQLRLHSASVDKEIKLRDKMQSKINLSISILR